MRLKPVLFPLILATMVLGAQLPDAPWHVHAQQSQLPPVSYVCPMDADVLEDKPGNCPICKMALEPVRIDTAFSCPNHAAVIRDKAGACPIDKRELVQVIVAKYWLCGDAPSRKLPDPGKCTDGSARTQKVELRAHGDHNPRHGGSFFMAEDKWHHLEGTYPSDGLFRAFFFDNFTKPLAPKGFTGRVVFEEGGKETASFPLSLAKNGQTLEAQLKGMPATPSKTTPVKLAAKLKFDPKTPEQRFDFIFAEYSKEPPTAPAASAPRSTAAAPATGTGTTASKPAVAASIAKPAATTAASSAKPTAPAAAAATAATPARAAAQASQATPPPPAIVETLPTPTAASGLSQTTSSVTLSRTDAATLVENLPTSAVELVKILEQRTQEVKVAIDEGQYGYVYIPALLSKDIALAVGDHVNELPEQRRASVAAAVRRLVLSAWDLDFFGDLGNKEKITEAYNSFAAAAADIKAGYGTSR